MIRFVVRRLLQMCVRRGRALDAGLRLAAVAARAARSRRCWGSGRRPSVGRPWRPHSASTSRSWCSTSSSSSARSRATSASPPRCCPARTRSTSSSTGSRRRSSCRSCAMLLADRARHPARLPRRPAPRLGRRHGVGHRLARRGGGAGLLHGLPAQVLLRGRVEPAPGLGPAEHRRSTPPASPAFRPRRHPHPGVGRVVGRAQAPDPARRSRWPRSRSR